MTNLQYKSREERTSRFHRSSANWRLFMCVMSRPWSANFELHDTVWWSWIWSETRKGDRWLVSSGTSLFFVRKRLSPWLWFTSSILPFITSHLCFKIFSAVSVWGRSSTYALLSTGSLIGTYFVYNRCDFNLIRLNNKISFFFRRKTAINDIAVRPITQFPVSLAEEVRNFLSAYDLYHHLILNSMFNAMIVMPVIVWCITSLLSCHHSH